MNRASKTSRSCRGVAPIELLLALPMLTMLFMLLLTVAAAGVVCLDVSLSAREQAWAPRHEQASDAELDMPLNAQQDRGLQRIFRTGQRPSHPQRMLRSGKTAALAEQRQEHGLHYLVSQLPQATATHSFFHGTWDQREIKFDRRERHKVLRLEQRLLGFSPSGFSLRAFEKLMP